MSAWFQRRALGSVLLISIVSLGGCDGGSGEPVAEAAAGRTRLPRPRFKNDEPPQQADHKAPRAEAKAAPRELAEPPVVLAAAELPAGSTPVVDPLPAGARTQDERNTIDVFRAAAPATVFVRQSQVVVDRWSRRAAEVPAGAGTGFVWDQEGHIVTNCHVALPDCELGRVPPKLEVTLFDQKSYEAKLVGFDRFKDIAVLDIDAPAESLIPLARPPKGYALEVGQKTVAIGNPFGLDHTLTTGVVSALGREVRGVGGTKIRDMVQTDAAINPGNSGGPLLDSQGQLIGMNTMIFSASGSSAGIGFAVPVETIERLVPQLLRSGRAERVGLGVQVVSEDQKRQLRANFDGVIVSEVKTPTAARAGLRSASQTQTGFVFDVIVGIEGKPVHAFDDLYGALEGRKAGDRVRVDVQRYPEGTRSQLEVELTQIVE